MRALRHLALRTAAAYLAAFAIACGGGGGGGGSPAPQPSPTGEPSPAPSPTARPTPTPAQPGWVVQSVEDFEHLTLPVVTWSPDPVPDDGPFADAGAFFAAQAIKPPAAYRITQPFGAGGWLTFESYTRDAKTPFEALASVVPDPAGGGNKVLRIASPRHTDATIVRPSAALPSRYRISLRVGFASFGDGSGLNGYSGGETAEPWRPGSATGQNGFYWLTILDSMPRPHNNVWIHHHRKVVVDSDNNLPPAFTEIWNGSSFVSSGVHPVMMFALDGRAPVDDWTGPPFLSWSAGQWQPSGAIRAVDAYLPGEWYQVTLERFDTTFTIELSGRFQYGGKQTYRATIDAAAQCVLHFNVPGQDASRCAGPAWWPANQSWPDWFMFGDPHENFYEGSVHYDDVKLEVWR